MFFDLQPDPLEMENLYENEAYQGEIATLRDRLLAWSLFESRPKNHVDHNAPRCNASNVPREDTGLYTYFSNNMTRNANNIETGGQGHERV